MLVGDETAEDFQVLSELETLVDSDDAAKNEKPPEVSEEELSVLDEAAEQKEVERLIGMGVLVEVVDGQKGYVITTKMVNTWKRRLEAGGWFRRARLVARQFKWSVFTDFCTDVSLWCSVSCCSVR